MAKLPAITNELMNEVILWHKLARKAGRFFSWKKKDPIHYSDKMFTEEYNRKMTELEAKLALNYKVDCTLELNTEHEEPRFIDDKFIEVSYRETKDGEKTLTIFICRVLFKDHDDPFLHHGSITERYQFDGSDISWLTDLFGKPETVM